MSKMSRLEYASDEELQQELDRRRKKREAADQVEAKPFDAVNWAEVYQWALVAFAALRRTPEGMTPDEYWEIGQKTMEAVFGSSWISVQPDTKVAP